jgi:hypothetical protein
MRPERMFAYVIFIGVLAISLNAALLLAARRMPAARSREAAHA